MSDTSGLLASVAEHLPFVVFRFELRPDGELALAALGGAVDRYGLAGADLPLLLARAHPDDRAALLGEIERASVDLSDLAWRGRWIAGGRAVAVRADARVWRDVDGVVR